MTPRMCGRAGCVRWASAKSDRSVYCSNACKVAAHKARRAAAHHAQQDTVSAEYLINLGPAARRVLRLLQNVGGQGATTAELCQPHVGGVRFSARILEIRAEGWVITKTQLRSGQYRYWCLGHADRPTLAMQEQPAA